MMLYEGKGESCRALGVYKPELFKLTIALWWLYVTLSWDQSPYRRSWARCFNIFVVVE